MATFLELCQDVARQSGTLAGGITISSVTDVSGRPDKVVDWVKKAWLNIQNERRDWLWMREEFTSALSIGTQRYSAASFGISRFSRWLPDSDGYQPFTIYDSALGQSDETELMQVPYRDWKRRWDRLSPDSKRPTEYAISPSLEFCVGATPDQAYAIRGEYRLAPQVLAANDDIPEMPTQHHDLIVYEALRLMGASDESVATTQLADGEVRRRRYALTAEQLPDVELQGSL